MNIERGPYTNAIVFTGGSYNIFSYYTKVMEELLNKLIEKGWKPFGRTPKKY